MSIKAPSADVPPVTKDLRWSHEWYPVIRGLLEKLRGIDSQIGGLSTGSGSLSDRMTAAESDIAALEAGKAAVSQTFSDTWPIIYPEVRSYPIHMRTGYAFQITETSIQTDASTCSFQIRKNGTAIATITGTTTRTNTARSGATWSFAVNDDLDINVTAVGATCEMVSVSIKYTRTLGA